MTDRLTEGLKYVATELSCTADEFRRANQPAGDMLLDALLSTGYVRVERERIGVTAMGLRRLADLAPVEEPEVE